LQDQGIGKGGRSGGKLLVAIFFLIFASLNLVVMVQANQLAFSEQQQPYDFYVLLHASSQVFSAPSLLYAHQDTYSFSPYWAKWLWYGASYLYAPMFATLLSPLSSLNPPDAKMLWEGLSYVLLVAGCLGVVKVVPSTKARLFLALMIFVMPLQIIYTDQTLPQFWLPQMTGMWISPVFYADYYWGNTNTAILGLGLLSYYFAVRRNPINIGAIQFPGYVFSSLFLALDTFKPTAALLILPFWMMMNKKKALQSIGLLALLVVALNSVALFEPTLISGYISALVAEPQAALWQVYEYVWYYTLPIVGIVLVWYGQSRTSLS
jgi:hypothetical protein